MALDKLITNNFPFLNGKIEIHDILWPDNILKMTSSQYSEIALASWLLEPWATRLFVQQIIQTNNKASTKAPYHWVLWEPPITGSPHKWVGNAGIAIDIMTVTRHIVAQYGDINLSTLTQVRACCLTELNHYLEQFWLIIGKVQWGDTSAIIYLMWPKFTLLKF